LARARAAMRRRGAWMPGTYDAENEHVSSTAPAIRAKDSQLGPEGDNIYTASVVALDGQDRQLKWMSGDQAGRVGLRFALRVMLFKKNGRT